MYLYIEDVSDSNGIISVIQILMDHPPTDEDGIRFYKFLVEREEEWELGRYGKPDVTPGQTLNELMLANGLDPGSPEMWEIFGSPRQVWLAVNDQTEVTDEQAEALAIRFHPNNDGRANFKKLFLKKKEGTEE